MDVEQLILPGACFFCLKKTNYAWCKNCEQDFILDISRCPVCARQTPHNAVCGACLMQLPDFTSAEVLFKYQYPVNYLIKAFKFYNRPELAHCFAEILANKIIEKAPLPKTIIPVPLHKKRQRERGYNQSQELAVQISKRLGLTLNPSLCRRIKNTDPQSTLPMKIRRKNVKDAFCLNSILIPKHIAIVDDVITTGSTINELARLLKKGGCQRIDVWAIART
jgi:ComF family protein